MKIEVKGTKKEGLSEIILSFENILDEILIMELIISWEKERNSEKLLKSLLSGKNFNCNCEVCQEETSKAEILEELIEKIRERVGSKEMIERIDTYVKLRSKKNEDRV